MTFKATFQCSFLKNEIWLFTNLEDHLLRNTVMALESHNFLEGETIFKDNNDYRDDFYIIKNGKFFF